MGVSSPSDAAINCTFLSGFTGSDHCAVQYGTDPTYINLPYSAESTETGTAGDSVSVVLRERLNSSTLYYCNVSAVSGDVAVTVQVTFTTPLYSMCMLREKCIACGIVAKTCMFTETPHFTDCILMELWNLPGIGLTFLTDISLLDNVIQYRSCDAGSVGSVALENTRLDTETVAYYTGTTPGSRACFVCDESNGFVPNITTTAERVCQSNGSWSGSPILCGML